MKKFNKNQKFFWILVFSLFSLISLSLLSLLFGSVNLFSLSNRELAREIFLLQRLPQMVVALFAGASLAVCGLILQSWFKNPLADPAILGISSGAGLGIALTLMGSNLFPFISDKTLDFLLPFSAPIGAAIVILPLLYIATRFQSTTILLLFGLLISYLSNALISILIHFSSAERVKSYIGWTFGNFSSVRLETLPFFVGLLTLPLVGCFFLLPSLNRLQLGREYGISMGLNIARLQFFYLVLISLSVGLVTYFCGPISFLGVAAAHFSRSLLKSSDYRKLMPLTLLFGANLALLSDLIARLPGSGGIPLNAVLALVGVPVVLLALLKPARLGSGDYE